MRIGFVHPNYCHSGGAEIAGTRPPAWVADPSGTVRDAGLTDVHFIDAMTDHLGEDELRQRLAMLPAADRTAGSHQRPAERGGAVVYRSR